MMGLAIVILLYLLVRVLVVLNNYAVQPYLIKLIPENSPLVSVLIPARNEAENIGNLLNALSEQSYGNIEVLVYDDQSEDATADIVNQKTKTDTRILLLKGNTLPDGWLGKNYGCYSLAQKAKGNYFLFLDADVIPSKTLIANAVGFMQHKKAKLLSIFPHQIKKTFGEELTVALMYDILLSLLPLGLIPNSTNHNFSAANGQFMLFERKCYLAHQPHWWKKLEPTEDIAIASLYKKLNEPCITLLGGDDISCRMYRNGSEAIKGFSKNIIRFFGNSIIFTLFHLLATTLGLGIVILTKEHSILSIYLIGVLVNKAVIGRISGESVLKAWLLILPRHIAYVIVVVRAFVFRAQKNYTWKGRNVNI